MNLKFSRLVQRLNLSIEDPLLSKVLCRCLLFLCGFLFLGTRPGFAVKSNQSKIQKQYAIEKKYSEIIWNNPKYNTIDKCLEKYVLGGAKYL